MSKSQEASVLAGDEGKPIRGASLALWPSYDEDEIAAAERVLRSGKVNYWTGDECRQFESEFAEYHGVAHGIALANGTLALELALRVLNIGAGDEVIVTPRSFFASASCIVLAGATPVFVDIDENSQNIRPDAIESAITDRTKAIIAVHLAGWPCDMPAIMDLAHQHSLFVIEDCAQAHGARINGDLVGSFGDLAAFSFCQDKIMTTAGEGGMLLTNNSALWQRAWEYKDHGKSWERIQAHDHPVAFRWLHESFGSNWRLTEIQGAIGRIQLRKLDDWVRARRANASRLQQGLRDLSLLRIPEPSAGEYHAYYKFYAFVRPERIRRDWSRDRILTAMQAEGIPGLSGACPEIYREKAFSGRHYDVLPTAHELGKTSIMFMVHPTLEQCDIDDMIHIARKVCSVATR
jgi:dTDP-4-amino-4,6-dideoxygalactose transaminase